MAAATPLKQPVKVGLLMRRRLRELKRTPRELAAAVQGSETYIADLLAGRSRLLDSLDAGPAVLTLEIYEDFVRPRVAAWDLDLDTQAMRIVLRSQEPAPRQKRALAI